MCRNCIVCNSIMRICFVWDDAQITDHCHNLYVCDYCGTILQARLWEDRGDTWIRPDGSIELRGK